MSDLDIYKKQNFGNRVGIGRRAALAVVDFTVGFNDPSMVGGGNIPPAHKRTDDGSDAGAFAMKAPALKGLTETAPAGQVVPELTPLKGEYMVRKTQASAFFGTGFGPWLVQQGVDTLVVTGCTTSGCVRATVVDSVSHNFRTIVARDCVGDRAMGPHEANLFDMGQKYADLMDRDEIIAEISRLARAA
jgi:maleamate amidohydrolase